MCKWIDEEYLGLQSCSPSCCGVDPFTSSITPIDLRMHSYIQCYLDNVVPVLRPFEEQTALLKDSLLNQLNRSLLVLYATLSVTSLRVDNYSDPNGATLSFRSLTPFASRQRLSTRSFMQWGLLPPSKCHLWDALVCVITYELLVKIFRLPKPIFKACASCWNLMAGSRRYVLPTLLLRPYRRCIKLFARWRSTQNTVLMATVHKLSYINLMRTP
jgi:hypothetical protein